MAKARDEITLVDMTDVAALTPWYLQQASTASPPVAPTDSPPGGGWQLTEPTYTAGATVSLYMTLQTVFSNGECSYSTPTLYSSYEAAKAAYNAAAAAQAAAAAAQTFYCAINTAAATAAKVPASTVAGFSLRSGVCIAVKFTYANTAASPTLNVNSTGAKGIRLNGAAYAYWSAGATVQFVYDGTYWQVCNTPLYGSTATIGNPAGGNVLIDGDSVEMRDASDVLAAFSPGALSLGGAAATVGMCGGVGKVCTRTSSGQIALMGTAGVYMQTTADYDGGADYGMGLVLSGGRRVFRVVADDVDISGAGGHEWRRHASVAGTAAMALPAEYGELLIVGRYGGGEWCSSAVVPAAELAGGELRLRMGGYATEYSRSEYSVLLTSSSLSLLWAYTESGNLTASSVTTVYYR